MYILPVKGISKPYAIRSKVLQKIFKTDTR